MNFETVLKILIEKFEKGRLRFALIGGFALHTCGFMRASDDVDFLAAGDDSVKIKNILQGLGYEVIHESPDVATFVSRLSELGRVDCLYAHRKYTLAMLDRATKKEIFGGRVMVKVVTPEDLIGLKVQSSTNDSSRYFKDMADIEEVLKANKGTLNLDLIKEYFELFNRKDDLNDLMKRVSDAV